MIVTHEYIYCNIWDWETPDLIIRMLENTKNSTFIYDCQQEFEFPLDIQTKHFLKINKLIEQNNIDFYFIVGSFDFFDRRYPKNFIDNITIIKNPTYWLDSTFDNIKKHLPVPQTERYDKLFTCFIGKPHFHRCQFIDELYGTGINTLGNHTWNGMNMEYDFENWEQKIIYSDDGYNDDKLRDNWIITDTNYNSSLFDLVVESSNECIFYTEKTYKPILLQKLFIIYGHPNINKKMTELGFVLYDDIIDYEFDSITDDTKRAKSLCNELKRISTLEEDYSTLYELTRDKIKYNYQHALSLIHNNTSTETELRNLNFNQENIYHSLDKFTKKYIQ